MTGTLEVSHKVGAHRYRDVVAVPLLTLLAGLTLVPLLPIGMFVGFGSAYQCVFFIHLVALMCAVAASIRAIDLASGSSKWVRLGVALLILALLVACLVAGAVPITATDALVHHLAVPKWWVERGYVSEISWHEWSYYPMLLNLAYAAMIKLGLNDWCAYYHGAYLFVMTGIVSSFWLSEREDKPGGVVAIVLTASLPIFGRLATVPLVDLGLATFSVAAVFFLWCLSGQVDPIRRAVCIVACGISLGLAASTKYNGFLFAAVMGALLIVTALKGCSRLIDKVFIAGCAFATLSPWLAKNWWWTGNPVYPLYRNLLGGPQLILPGAPMGLPPLQHRALIYDEGALEILLLPLRVFYEGIDGDPRHFDGVLNPLLLVGIILVYRLRDPVVRTFCGVTGILYIFAAFTLSSARARYLAPILPGLCVIGGSVSDNVASSGVNRYLWMVRGGVVVASLWISLSYWSYAIFTPQVRDYLRGDLSRRDYLAQEIPEFGLIEYVNEKLPKSSRLYLLGTGNRFYYFGPDVISRGYFSFNEIISWVKTGRSADEIRDEFTKQGVTHLFVHSLRMQETLAAQFTPNELAVWNQFSADSLRGVVGYGDYALWEIGKR